MSVAAWKSGMQRPQDDGTAIGSREQALAQAELLAATQARCQQLERDLTVRKSPLRASLFTLSVAGRGHLACASDPCTAVLQHGVQIN